MTFTIAPETRLAAAQGNIVTRLTSAMDMTLCCDAVSAITAWWPAEITGAGYAVLGTAGGIRVSGPPAPLAEIPRLPAAAQILSTASPA